MPNTPGCSPDAPQRQRKTLSNLSILPATLCSEVTGARALAAEDPPAPAHTSHPSPGKASPSSTLLQPWPRCYVTPGSPTSCPCVGHTHALSHTRAMPTQAAAFSPDLTGLSLKIQGWL